MIARRIYWATMPYWGWVRFDEGEEGGVPHPWWSVPLCWLHLLTQWWLHFTRRSTYGPRANSFTFRYPDKPPKPWQ